MLIGDIGHCSNGMTRLTLLDWVPDLTGYGDGGCSRLVADLVAKCCFEEGVRDEPRGSGCEVSWAECGSDWRRFRPVRATLGNLNIKQVGLTIDQAR